jgi:hypothetical protein
MSDSQYWTSLWGVGLIIFLIFFILFLGLAVFTFFYDRISLFEIWNSPVWLKIKVPLIILCVIGFLTALIAYIGYEGRKELQAAREYAQDRGWSFSQNDTQGLKTRAAKILWDLNFDLYYIRTVETGKCNLYLFDCSYKHREATASVHDSHGTACFIQSNRFQSRCAPLDIAERDWTEVMQSDKVDMGESLFVQKFLVLSKYPAMAKEIVNKSIQSIMLDHLEKPLYNPVCVSIGPGGAVVLTGLTLEHERLQDLIDLARRIEAVME